VFLCELKKQPRTSVRVNLLPFFAAAPWHITLGSTLNPHMSSLSQAEVLEALASARREISDIFHESRSGNGALAFAPRWGVPFSNNLSPIVPAERLAEREHAAGAAGHPSVLASKPSRSAIDLSVASLGGDRDLAEDSRGTRCEDAKGGGCSAWEVTTLPASTLPAYRGTGLPAPFGLDHCAGCGASETVARRAAGDETRGGQQKGATQNQQGYRDWQEECAQLQDKLSFERDRYRRERESLVREQREREDERRALEKQIEALAQKFADKDSALAKEKKEVHKYEGIVCGLQEELERMRGPTPERARLDAQKLLQDAEAEAKRVRCETEAEVLSQTGEWPGLFRASSAISPVSGRERRRSDHLLDC